MKAVAREAERQSRLLAAVLARADASPGLPDLQGTAAQQARGLVAYRSHAGHQAERALAAAFPTVQALVGDDDFSALARALWRAAPPRHGDLARWGSELPAFIEAERDFDPWPYLADSARLDAAIRRCESASDAELQRDTLALLAGPPADALRLRLLPSLQLLASDWPVATIHAAHLAQAADGDLEAAFAPVRTALAARRGESVVVSREGWRARVATIDPASWRWMAALQAGRTLADALSAAGADFDFNAWLVQALQRGWLWKAEPIEASFEENPS